MRSSMAFLHIFFTIILIWNGINSQVEDGSGTTESSGDASGDALVIESGDGSGDVANETIADESSGDGSSESTNDTLVVDGSGESNDTYSGEGFIAAETTTAAVTETTEGSAESSGDTTVPLVTDASGEGTTSSSITDGSGSGDEEFLTVTEATTTVSGDGSGDEESTTVAEDGSGESTTVAESGSGEMTTDSGSGEMTTINGTTTNDSTTDEPTTTESAMACNQATANAKPLELYDISVPSKVTEGEDFQINFRIKDSTSGNPLSSLTWSDCAWTASVQLSDTSSYKILRIGFLSVTSGSTINQGQANVTISGVSLSNSGMAVLIITLSTNPSAYELQTLQSVIIQSAAQNQISVQATTILNIKFEYDYNTYATEEFRAMVYNFVLNKLDDKVILSIELIEGSIIARVTIGANTNSDITTLTTDVCGDLSANTSLSYQGLSISMSTIVIKGDNGDASCHVESTDSSNILVIGLAAGIVFCVLGIIILAAILYWRFRVYPNKKVGSKEELMDEFEEEFVEQYTSYDSPEIEKQAEVFVKYLGTSHFVEEKLWRESFSSLREKSVLADNPLAPIATSIPNKGKGGFSSYGPKFHKVKQRQSAKVHPADLPSEPLPPLMINGRRVNIPTKFSPFNFSFKK